jgi:alpha-mannosidase
VPEMVVSGAAGEKSIFNLDADNIIIEAIKPAEDASGDIVLRLYEAMRMNTTCTLNINLPVKSIFATNMLEEIESQLHFDNNALSLHFRPFEIKTLRLRVK